MAATHTADVYSVTPAGKQDREQHQALIAKYEEWGLRITVTYEGFLPVHQGLHREAFYQVEGDRELVEEFIEHVEFVTDIVLTHSRLCV